MFLSLPLYSRACYNGELKAFQMFPVVNKEEVVVERGSSMIWVFVLTASPPLLLFTDTYFPCRAIGLGGPAVFAGTVHNDVPC